jgi:glycosyltransferase involved in cell wall biosynthesis
VDLLIAGLKQPEMAVQAASALQKPGRIIEILDDHVPREEFLAKIGNARNVLFLPNRDEGFYLPALEGMALGALVICPDCVGNRGFMNGRNAIFPPYELPALIEATETALMMSAHERAAMLEQARATLARHQPVAERAAYSEVLRNLDQLWSEA